MGGEHITSMTPCFTLSIGVFPPTNKAQANKYFFLNTNFFFWPKVFLFACVYVCIHFTGFQGTTLDFQLPFTYLFLSEGPAVEGCV